MSRALSPSLLPGHCPLSGKAHSRVPRPHPRRGLSVMILGGAVPVPDWPPGGAAGRCRSAAAGGRLLALAQPSWAPGTPGLPSSCETARGWHLQWEPPARTERQCLDSGHPWAPVGELGHGAREWRPTAFCPSGCTRSAASGEWVRLHSPALAALLFCRALGQKHAWGRGSRVIAPAPVPCPARPFLGALAASLCSGQPSGPAGQPSAATP